QARPVYIHVQSLIPSEKGDAMSSVRLFVGSILLLVTGTGAAWSEEKRVVVPGEPPLTQDMVDDYGKFLSWRLGPESVARAGGEGGVRQMSGNGWEWRDKQQGPAFLATLKWWCEDFPKLSKEAREELTAANRYSVEERERPRQLANAQAIHRLMVQRALDTRQLQILALSNIQAAGHET